jgi:transcriptional regulator with XRE-family HTH domain
MAAKTIGAAVRAAREAKGLTQRAVAKTVGMTVPQLSNLEAGTPPNPGWKTVVKLARAVGLSLDEAAGLKAFSPMPSSIPRSVTSGIAKAKRDVAHGLARLEDLERDLESRS